jgi:preprotein translocase subunit Sss1
MKNSVVVTAKILEIGPREIKYKKYGNENGPLYIVTKNEVQKIRYANGTEEEFSGYRVNDDYVEKKFQSSSPVDIDACAKGKMDALLFYKPDWRHYGMGALGALAGIVTGGAGCAGGIAWAGITDPDYPPRTKVRNPDLLDNRDYRDCYVKKAKYKQAVAAATGCAGVTVIGAVGYILLLEGLNRSNGGCSL